MVTDKVISAIVMETMATQAMEITVMVTTTNITASHTVTCMVAPVWMTIQAQRIIVKTKDVLLLPPL